MKKMKKILIFTLLIILITTSAVFAEGFEDIKGTKYEEAVDFLSAYNVINGFPDGTFKPEEPITRGQIAKILTIALGYEEFSKNLEGTFDDMEGHWARRYVNVVDSFNIVRGYPDGSFGPDGNVTYSEGVTMVLRTLGYTDESLPGDWPYDYLVKATDLGILHNVSVKTGDATRGDIALMIYNAMENNLVRINDKDFPIKTEEKLFDNLGYYKNNITINKNFIEKNQKNSKINLEDYRFHKGNVYYDNQEDVVYIKNFQTREYKGTVDSASDFTIFVKNEGGNIRPFNLRNAPIIFNNDTGNYNSLVGGEVKVIYEEEGRNTYVRGVIGKKITDTAFVTASYKEGEAAYAGVDLPLDNGKPALDKVEVWGAVDNIYDIKEKDFLYFYDSDRSRYTKSYLGIHVIRDSVIGVIKATSVNKDSEGYSLIDGKRYDHSSYYIPNNNLAPGYYARAYLDKERKVVKYDLIQYLLEPDTYGLVLSTQEGNSTTLPKVVTLDKNAQYKTLSIPRNNDLVVNIDEFNSMTYSLNLKGKDIIKYNIKDDGSIDKFIKKDLEDIESTYNEATGNLNKINKKITDQTIIYFKDGNSWKSLNKRNLAEIVSGKVIVNYQSNEVEVFILEEGIKTNLENYINAPVLKVSETLDLQDKEIYKLYVNIGGRERVLYTENTNIKIEELINNFLRLNIVNDKVTSVKPLVPEVKEKKIESIYKDTLIKIDGAFWEFDDNVEIYTAVKGQEGKLEFTGYIDIGNLKSGDILSIYDIDGKFDGKIDHAVLIKDAL